ncbi:MAG: class I SAM-dependent methyltransferase [Gammaproteobacteria bacterium]
MLFNRSGVCAADAASVTRAQDIATRLDLPYSVEADQFDVALMVSENESWLRRFSKPVMDWHIDFLSPAYREKRAKRTRKNDTLSRALGLHKKAQSRVLDMSAGLGKDAYWIAYCGASVTLIERNPILAFLLEEAIHALRLDPIEGAIGNRMTLVKADASSFLETVNAGQFDVAYYDPMFMPRRKSALVKKDMQIMHDLLGEDPMANLLEKTLEKIPCLVVKRAKSDPPYHPSMHHDAQTGTTRYEIYRKI